MVRNQKAKLARRCAGCLVLVAIAVAVVPVLVEGQPSAPSRKFAQEQFATQVHYHIAQMPVGHVQQIFMRNR